ncbi:MAG: pantetheine-phosphate adenylyltransferase [Clostridia bacterium]|jgi:pantetheine-phosphate adenylyltransferase|nr:pantetheine-phosphate adenylyltransferase [Clostridia bacterium]MCI1959105.1 pantetheine-phosphate adenylyltransferase [Clostridia bacterium]MCI2001018.1 pantetheine-phosphate adenylyltransferase [Clostridia bacterium]MCI2015617.1 pantetheine-phosphate adenylyltransferase [Clostridia bacterium]
MIKAIYPGSFDPVTNGHLDIIKRASKLVDKLVVSVLENPHKKSSLFTVEERIENLKLVTKDIKNIEISSFRGLLVDYAQQIDAQVIIRGLRAVTDFESEFQMALTNKSLFPNIETLFIPTSIEYLYLSSSTVKEIAMFGGNICGMVPCEIKESVLKKFRK